MEHFVGILEKVKNADGQMETMAAHT